MERARFVRGILFVLGLGLLIPGSGCFGSSDDELEGFICASPIEGGKHCVNASSGPSAAWNEAIVHGSEPIQMWAVWPKKRTLRDVVASPALLDAWLDDMRTILDYVRVTKGSAESYKATMEGRMKDDLERARRVQNEIIFEKRMDPQKDISERLVQKAALEIDPVKANVAAEKQILNEVQAVLDKAQLEGAPFVANYKALVDDFVAYRSTEAGETLPNRSWLEIFCNGAFHNVAIG